MNAFNRITLACVSLLGLWLAPVGAVLAQVKVTSATPSSAYQGTISLDVVVGGSGFNKSARAAYYVSGTTDPGGITVRGTTFRSSTELVTTIDVASTATLASFDIVVTLDTGRKGKGTTLFSVKSKPGDTTPTYPPARSGQGFASSGGTTSGASRLYMFGGRKDGTAIGDLWSYANAGSTGATWTYIPGGTSSPGTSYPSPRAWVGWSCGAGLCVASNGVSTSIFKETWIFSESTRTWSQVACNRVLCPSARLAPAMAYDQAHGVHVLFGGDSGALVLADTYTFNASTKTWTQVNGGVTPPARSGAAATYVPNVGIVMFGGYGNPCCVAMLNDMYVWNGSAWAAVTSVVNGGTTTAVPALWDHSMAWDPARGAMIVSHGLVDSSWTPNNQTWYVTFSRAGGAWQANWALASVGCQAAASSPPDATIYPGAQMAFDAAAGVQVFFGGDVGITSMGNTVECR